MTDYKPTSADVAAEMPTRTIPDSRDVTVDPDETTDFSAETRPNKVQVDAAIGEALALIAPRLGDVPEELTDFAKRVVVLRTALLLERRFWPEEVDDDRGVYTTLRDELNEVLSAYDAARAQDGPGESHRTASLRVGTLLSGL